jgi:hypothetical protein
MVWITAIMKRTLSARAVARTLLATFEPHKPLSEKEAERVRVALERSGVPEAATRLNATWSKIILRSVTE